MKKECYFNSKNIDKTSQEIINYINNFRKKHFVEVLTPKSGLLVTDMQNYFLDKTSHAFIPSSLSIISNINYLINEYKKNKRPVIFTKHDNDKDNAFLMEKWWRNLIKKKDPLSNINKAFDLKGHCLVEKTQYDAFFKTELLDILKKNNIEQLTVTGVMTNLCCESTIRSAFVNGIKTLFVVDATATYNIELHKASFLNLSHGFTVPVVTEEIIKQMKRYTEEGRNV